MELSCDKDFLGCAPCPPPSVSRSHFVNYAVTRNLSEQEIGSIVAKCNITSSPEEVYGASVKCSLLCVIGTVVFAVVIVTILIGLLVLRRKSKKKGDDASLPARRTPKVFSTIVRKLSNCKGRTESHFHHMDKTQYREPKIEFSSQTSVSSGNSKIQPPYETVCDGKETKGHVDTYSNSVYVDDNENLASGLSGKYKTDAGNYDMCAPNVKKETHELGSTSKTGTSNCQEADNSKIRAKRWDGDHKTDEVYKNDVISCINGANSSIQPNGGKPGVLEDKEKKTKTNRYSTYSLPYMDDS